MRHVVDFFPHSTTRAKRRLVVYCHGWTFPVRADVVQLRLFVDLILLVTDDFDNYILHRARLQYLSVFGKHFQDQTNRLHHLFKIVFVSNANPI